MRLSVLVSASSARSQSSGDAGIVLRMRRIAAGKLDLVVARIRKRLHHCESEIDAVLNFLFDLLRHAEDVRVVLREAAHAQQAVQHAGALVAIHGAELGQAHRQIAIAAQARLVNQNVARAIHGLELVVGFFDFDRAEHVFAIEIGVAAGLPQIQAHDVRRVDEIVAAAQQFVAQPVFHQLANQAALGMPEDQARAGFFLDAEKIELRPEPAMVAALGFFELVEIFVELFLCPRSTRRKCAASADCFPGPSSRRRRHSSV